MDVACNVWKYDQKLCQELHELKALYALAIANKLEDDKCGEKVALLKSFTELNVTPEVVQSEYKRLKQQNDQVYFGKEQTGCWSFLLLWALRSFFKAFQILWRSLNASLMSGTV